MVPVGKAQIAQIIQNTGSIPVALFGQSGAVEALAVAGVHQYGRLDPCWRGPASTPVETAADPGHLQPGVLLLHMSGYLMTSCNH